MNTFTEAEAEARFDELLDMAQRTPIQVTRDGRAVGVLLGPNHFEAIRVFDAGRLARTADQVLPRSRPAGVTPKMLGDEAETRNPQPPGSAR